MQDQATLSQHLWALASRAASAADRTAAALHLLDWLGCALAGAQTDTGRRIRAVLAPGGNPFVLTGPQGAMAMGGLGSLLEMDDVHRTALLHPGPVVIPAVLAMAGPDGPVLDAILTGYDTMIRLGQAVGAGHYALFHNTATCGGIGAAAGAARVMGLTDAQAVGAIGHAMSVAGGLWQARHEPVATKHLHVAEAARRGAQGAVFAQADLGGPGSILDGPQGFFAGFAPRGDPASVLAPAADWKLAEVSFKPWSACRHAHPAIDAALSLRDRLDGAPATITVETYADAVTFCDRPRPQTDGDARFSLQHAMAVVLARGRPGLADFAGPAMTAPDLAALRDRVTVAADPAFTARYPAHFGARVTITTTTGQTLTASVADAWGDPENPLDSAAIRAKFDQLAVAAGITSEDSASLASAVLALADGAPLSNLRAALARLTL